LRFRSELEHDVYPRLREEYITKVDIPEDFLKQFLLSSFIETLKWWLHQRQKMTVEDLLKYYLTMVER
ncbi:TPA: TetR/AcrR family transcriptional regulator, partial [Streptococcus agalactiae]|nr:TetR/AcrR family transcriptional regulator [Streptococcus agalactiae]